MKHNRWIIKYKSLTYIYLIWSIYVSHWSIIPTMMFIHQIILKILSKINRPWNYRSCWHNYFEVIVWVILSHYLKIYRLGDIRQNHWTMKYNSHRPTFIFRSNVGSHWPIIPKYGVHISNVLQDICKITGPWNIGHSDLHLFWGQPSSHTES